MNWSTIYYNLLSYTYADTMAKIIRIRVLITWLISELQWVLPLAGIVKKISATPLRPVSLSYTTIEYFKLIEIDIVDHEYNEKLIRWVTNDLEDTP